jgi:hypothetical protein
MGDAAREALNYAQQNRSQKILVYIIGDQYGYTTVRIHHSHCGIKMSQFESNLNALRLHHPALAERVVSIQPPETHYRVKATQTAPTLEVLVDDTWTAWHSQYDPRKEAAREIASLDQSSVYVPLFLGMGLGYTLLELWQRWKDELYDILVIEKDEKVFRLALEHSDFTDFFSHPRLHIHVGDNLQEWRLLCRKVMPGVMSSRLQPILHTPSRQTFTHYYQQAVGMLQDQIHTTQAEFDFTIKNGSAIQQNMWRNLPRILHSVGAKQIQHTWKSKPAVVVAAGPSLDKNVHQLCGMEDRVLIIAVDTAYRTLVQHNITPHIIVSTDPTELNKKHFEGINPSPQTILAFDPEVYWDIPHQWQQKTLFLNVEKTAITRWIEQNAGPFGFVPKGGSVGNTAYYLARIFGADPIIFAGLDLAFDPHGGKTHTGHAALTRDIQATAPGSQTTTLGALEHRSPQQENLVWVPGTVFGKVPTSTIMYIYIQQFNAEIQKSNATVIDATEGGARLTGTEIMSLQDALKQHAISGGCNAFVSSIQPHPNNSLPLKQQIDSMLNELEQATNIARIGLELCAKVEPLLHMGVSLREHEDWLKMDDAFQTIYHSGAVKIAVEQALFGAVFQFVHKEKKTEVASRLEKYHRYFQCVIACIPDFIQIIKKLEKQL